jgi:hypothetical protein
VSDKFQKVIVCRSARESRTPGALVGYECAICQEPLQITPSGKATLESSGPGTDTLCNECGLLYAQIADGAGRLAATEMGPEAKAQLDRGNESGLAHWIRKRMQKVS